MRLSSTTAFALLALCACAHAASIASTVPDKKDIEKKLSDVVKEVLSKDEVNETPSEPELNEQPAPVKDIENNLKSVPIDIPVKIVVETIYPAVKSEADKDENNEVSESQESAEIKREEPDLKNPGPPQRMQHDTQHPETFDDAKKKAAAQKEQWKKNPSYIVLQKELQNLKATVEAQISELQKSMQQYWAVNPDAEKKEHNIQLRASVKQDTTTTTTTTEAPFWSGNPLVQGWQNIQQNFQSNIGNFNNSLNQYFANQNQSSSCGGGWGWGGLGSNQQTNSQGNSGTQSDESRPPGLWQQVQQNVQNFFTGGVQQPPAGAQSDSTSPQPQPNRPVIQAFQSAIQQAGSLFNRPLVQPTQPAPPAQTEPEKVTSEGSNAVPAKPNEAQKQKPEQAVTQSGPIKQMIGSNPVVQGIAGAVQRIGQAIIPNKPRDDVKSVNADEKEKQEDKGGLLIVKPKPPHPPGAGDNNYIDRDVDIKRGVEAKKVPEEVKKQPEAAPAEETPETIQEQPAAAPAQPAKTE